MMNKLLWWLLGLVVLGVIFVLGRGYGEKKGWDLDLDFATQSVTNEGEKFTVTNKGNLKIYKVPVDEKLEKLGADTDFIECPGSKLDVINVDMGIQVPPKLYDGSTNSELSFNGYSFNFAATASTKSAKFLRSIRKNTLEDGQCIYAIMNKDGKPESLIVYSIKLVDNCVAIATNPEQDGKAGFLCN